MTFLGKMYILQKFRVTPKNNYFSITRKLCSKESKNDAVNCETDEMCPRTIEKKFTVGIIGGGMTPIYTAVLLKQLKTLRAINIVDVSNSLSGAVFDASHIDTKTKIKYYRKSSLRDALSHVSIIVISGNCQI